jgi:hypothetical protein
MWSSNPSELVNYKGSCTTAEKEIVDIEIAMYRNAGIGNNTCLPTITIGVGTIV